MANLQKYGKYYHVFFRLGGKQFKPSLKTTILREAENQRGVVEDTVKLLESGRLTVRVVPLHLLASLGGGSLIENIIKSKKTTQDVSQVKFDMIFIPVQGQGHLRRCWPNKEGP